RATRASREAKEQTAVSQAVKSFLTEDLLSPRDPHLDRPYDPKRKAAVYRAAEAVEGRFKDQPLTEAEGRYSLGFAFGEWEESAEAVKQLEKAVELFTRFRGREHSNTIAAESFLAYAYSDLEQTEKSEQVMADAIAKARRLSHSETLLAQALLLRGR